METLHTKTNFSLSDYGIENAKMHYQLSSEELQNLTVEQQEGVFNDAGALAINTGEFTGRSPQDRFIVKDEITSEKIWWGDINIPFSPEKFDALHQRVVQYLSDKQELFVRDSYVCADDAYRLNIRVINEKPWSNMFAYNMFLRPFRKFFSRMDNY